MILTKFVKRAFRVVFEVFFWILLLTPAIIGIVLSAGQAGEGQGYSLMSFLPLLLAGFLLTILLGGLISTFLDMAKNIEKLLADKEKAV